MASFAPAAAATWVESVPRRVPRASAHTRRRRRVRLDHELRRRLPGVAWVHVFPLGSGPRLHLVQLAAADHRGRSLPAPRARDIARLIAAAYPNTDFTTRRCWHIPAACRLEPERSEKEGLEK